MVSFEESGVFGYFWVVVKLDSSYTFLLLSRLEMVECESGIYSLFLSSFIRSFFTDLRCDFSRCHYTSSSIFPGMLD